MSERSDEQARCNVCFGSGEQFPTVKCRTCDGSGIRDRLVASEWGVRPWDKAEAGRFIATWHYSGSGNYRCVYAFGLFRHDDPDRLRGAALFSASLPKSAASFFAEDWRAVLSLSRLAVDPEVPQNGASFVISRCARLIRREGRYSVLASYADTWQGHTGAIYRAAGWEYLGTSTPSPVWVDDDGVVKPDHANGKRRDMSGLRMLGRFPKHRYRLILDPARSAA